MTARHVLIDGYFLGKPYGFGRYILELCRALGESRSDVAITVAVPDRIGEETLPRYRGLTWHRVPDANFIIWEQFVIPRLARRLSCDVIHFPYNTRALFTLGCRSITTVHDLMFLKKMTSLDNLRTFVAEKYSKLVFNLASRRSDAIVAMSGTTQASLRAAGLDSTVVYNTVDGFLEEAGSAVPPRGRPYVLHRGGYLPHRNTGRVIEAFQRVHRDLPDVDLKVLGAADGATVWNTGGDPSIQFVSRLSDADLAGLYMGASCVVAASLEEGFGLPIIEGFGFGTPVITSDIDPMREVAGGAAVLVDPLNADDIAQAMKAVLTDPSYSADLVAKGRERLASFRSTRIANQILDIYARCGTHADQDALVRRGVLVGSGVGADGRAS